MLFALFSKGLAPIPSLYFSSLRKCQTFVISLCYPFTGILWEDCIDRGHWMNRKWSGRRAWGGRRRRVENVRWEQKPSQLNVSICHLFMANRRGKLWKQWQVVFSWASKSQQTVTAAVKMLAWQPTLVFLPRVFLGQRSLLGYSSWGHKESDTERLSVRHRVRLSD